MFGLDAKIINYILGLKFAFVKERNPDQNVLAMCVKKENAKVFIFCLFKESIAEGLVQCFLPNIYFKNSFSIVNKKWRITCRMNIV